MREPSEQAAKILGPLSGTATVRALDRGTRPGPRRWKATLLMMVVGGASALAGVSWLAPSAVAAQTVSAGTGVAVGPVIGDLGVTLKPLGLLGPFDRLKYVIRTHYNAGSGCAGERVRTALIGAPTPVDIGGNFLPDATVTLVAIPGIGGSHDLLQVSVARTSLTTLRGRIEVIVAPDATAPGRIAFGYDACETGAPLSFSATISATDARISLQATTVAPTSALTVIGAAFDDVGGAATEPTALAARLAPVPASVSADFDIVGPSSYNARVKTSTPTNMRLAYDDVKGESRMNALATLERFPGQLDLTFTDAELAYAASAPVDRVGLSLESVRPAAAGDPPPRINQLTVDLLGVPTNARLLRTTPTRVTFTTPGTISSSRVGFTSFEPGVVLPALTRFDGQYLVANISPRYSQAEARVLGLSRADIDAGDPVLVDVTHTAGPFRVAAKVTTTSAGPPPVDVTRDLAVHVLDLPASAKVTYSPATQAFTYDGSAVIGELRADITSSVPLVDDANISHLLLRGMPTGLNGRLDTLGKTFTATLTGGSLSLTELHVTSGPDLRLPDGLQGVAVEDHAGSYAAFVRILGLQRATVGWGETQLADVVHTPGPFDVHVDIDDPDTADGTNPPTDIDADLTIRDLPGRARFAYTPAKQETPTVLTFAGNANVATLDLDVVSGSPIIASPNPGNVGANEAHILLKNIPPAPAGDAGATASLSLTIDGLGKSMSADVADGTVPIVMEAEGCSTNACGQPIDTGKLPAGNPASQDGLWLSDLADRYHLFTRVTGLKELKVSWGEPVGLHFEKSPGPFDIVVNERKTLRIFGVPFPHMERTSVTVHDLPSRVDLTYAKANQTIDYRGSATIGVIEAWKSVDRVAVGGQVVNAIAGRATEAHLRVEGVRDGVLLSFQFGAADDMVVVDTRNSVIGRIELELLSSPDLLPALAHTPTIRDRFDGLELWDLDDFDGVPAEPFDDPYAIVVRATNLTKFSYRTEILTDSDELNTYRSVDLQRAGGPSLWVQILKDDATKPLLDLGLPQSYKVKAMYVDYEAPPDRLGFMFGDRKQDPNRDRTFLFTYYGSAPGTRIEFRTNAGESSDSFTKVVLLGVPGTGGTPESPDVDVCIAGNNMYCSPKDKPDNTKEEFSVATRFTSPVTLNIEYRKDSGRRITITDLYIERGLTVSHETVTSGINSHRVYADTAGGTVNGRIHVTQRNFGGGLDTWIAAKLPPGLRADKRYVDIETEGVGFSHGTMFCPSGTVIDADSWGIDFDLTDDLCT